MPTRQDLADAIGEAIQERRASLGLTRSQFADALRGHQSHVWAHENGERLMTAHTLTEYAAALGCRGSDLLRDAELVLERVKGRAA